MTITPEKIARVLSSTIPHDLQPEINCCVLGAAAHGDLESFDTITYDALDKFFSLEVIKFEPDPISFEKENLTKRNYETWINEAIGDGGTHDFHATEYAACSSLLAPDITTMDEFNCGQLSRLMQLKSKERIETALLDKVVTKPIDDLRMDIQGAELMALKGAEATLNRVLTIQTEVSFVPQYINQPLFSEIELFLRKNKFNLARLMEPHHHPLTPFSSEDPSDRAFVPVWTDAIFVKSLFNPKLLNKEELLKVAIISGVRYQILDVMYRCLKQALPHLPTSDNAISKILN